MLSVKSTLDTRLSMWKNVPSAHDVAFRGWLTRTSDTSPVLSVALVAHPNPSQFKMETSAAYHGTALLEKIWSHRLTMKDYHFFQGKEFAATQIVFSKNT